MTARVLRRPIELFFYELLPLPNATNQHDPYEAIPCAETLALAVVKLWATRSPPDKAAGPSLVGALSVFAGFRSLVGEGIGWNRSDGAHILYGIAGRFRRGGTDRLGRSG